MKKAQPVDLNRIIPGITSFAWNANCSKIAVCPQSREVLIFETGNQPDITKWKLSQVLKEVSCSVFNKVQHYSDISSMHWHPKTNKLMTCSTDRGIIVWNEDATG
jgi:actin related protein 2/3 complex, subunit 1A/1B